MYTLAYLLFLLVIASNNAVLFSRMMSRASRCARGDCNQTVPDGLESIRCTDFRLRQRLYPNSTEDVAICRTHATEFDTLFTIDQQNMHIEVDDRTRCIDFVSNQKSSNKIPVKTFSITEITGTDNFQFVSATYNGVLLENSLVEGLLGAVSLGKRSRNVLSGSASDIAKIRDTFFASDLNILVEAMNKNASVTSADDVPTPFLVSLEGNIGAGKSTLLAELRRLHPDWYFIDEPVDTWTALKNDEGESLLEIFYADKKRWSYTFQNCALLSRYNLIEEAVKANNFKV